MAAAIMLHVGSTKKSSSRGVAEVFGGSDFTAHKLTRTKL